MDRGVASEGTAEVRWDKRDDVGKVWSWARRSDELETEQRQLWDRGRIGVDRARTRWVVGGR